MKHSGLQKSISSIFDGNEPIRQETAAPVAVAATQKPVAAAPAKQPFPVAPAMTPQVAAAAPITPAAVQTAPAAQTAAACQVIRPATRPQPVPKKNAAGHNTFSIKDAWKTVKGRLAGGSKGTLDARQKKTLILGISLAAVFVTVLLFALGSGPSGAKAASKKGAKGDSAADSRSGSTENWQKPEIYPLSLRDPMKPSSNSKTAGSDEGDMTVRGIVYSSMNPSAIIANQIVYEGDVILGVKIIKIGRDFVAFEKDGKKWQQQVRQ
jgi:hypothetical protein